MASPELAAILQFAVRKGVSDVHLKVERPPIFRKDGALVTHKGAPVITASLMQELVGEVVRGERRDLLERQLDVDTAFAMEGGARFRVHVFRQRDSYAMAFRVIDARIRSIEELLLPEAVKTVAEERRGLVLVTGATGSGKSTTMAALIDHINTTRSDHVVTIEDPIEYLFEDRRSIVSQREVGLDTLSFAGAVRAAMRQDPDVILIGEMRDRLTVEAAMQAAESGHLVISTLHTIDAPQTVGRIVSFFPPHEQRQVRLLLASLLKSVISQRLVARRDGAGRVPAVELLIATELVRELVADEARTGEIRDALAKGKASYGTQTFDQSLMDLYKGKLVSYEEALGQSSNPADFALKVSGISGTSEDAWG